MAASHNQFLVVLSVVVSILGAYATIAAIERLREARSRLWLTWLVGGAIVDGIGTWSMHYTGMLALRLPVSVEYYWPNLLLSLLVGIIGSAGALIVLSRRGMRERTHLIGGEVSITSVEGQGIVVKLRCACQLPAAR
jgi:NO-binding membrane sensor protein with MHYT domain